MKFNKSRQLLLVSAVSLLAAGLMTACGTATTDFVFVASAKAAGPNSYGEINVFEINRVSGAMRQIPSSPFPSGGRDPVAEAVSSDDSNLYVVNEDDNTIVQFMIGSDGKLYPQNTVNTPGIYPLGVAVSGSNLFVVDTYQPLSTCSNAQPCSGSVAVFPIEPASGTGSSEIASGKLGAPVANGGLTYWPLCQSGYISDTDYTHCKTGGTSASSDVITPTAINVMASSTVNYVFVTAYDSTVTPAAGYVFGFSAGSDGALMPLNGGVPVAAGIHPSAIASDSNSHIYVTDSKNGDVRAFTIASGALSELSGSPFAAGNQPSAIVVDPLYPFAYIANAQDGNISAYSIGSNGALASIGTFATGTQPVAIGIDPSTSHFLFTANFLGSNISDFELNSTTGTLINAQHSPYTSNALPTAVAAIPHGGTKK